MAYPHIQPLEMKITRKLIALFLSTSLGLANCAQASAASVDLKAAFQHASAGSVPFKLELGHGLNVVANVQMTNKGNGTLTLPNLSLRLFDQHDDGVVYRGGLLTLDVVRLGKDRYASLIISGILQRTGEKESDPVDEGAVVFIYQLDCRRGKFVQTYRRSSVEIAMPIAKAGLITCR